MKKKKEKEKQRMAEEALSHAGLYLDELNKKIDYRATPLDNQASLNEFNLILTIETHFLWK